MEMSKNPEDFWASSWAGHNATFWPCSMRNFWPIDTEAEGREREGESERDIEREIEREREKKMKMKKKKKKKRGGPFSEW